MSFNGSGTFLINSTGQPVVANTVISATVFNALTADLASGLTNCITKDGQSTPTANIPMGSNKITGLANGTLASDAATLGQVQTTAAKLITSVSGVDTVTGIMSPTLTAYAAGQLFYFVAVGANTGAVTLNIDGLGAKAVTRDGSTALAAGDINSGEMVVVIYDGTRFQMINAANSFGNTTINGTLTVTGNTGLQANVSITSTLSVGGTFAVTGAATLGSTLAVTGKSDLPTVSTASINAAVAVVTTGTVTNLTSTSASIASVNAGVALLTTATVTDLTATGASIASANIGNLQFTAASIASINAGVAVVTNLTATSASIASANVGTAVVTTGTVTNLTSTSASIASANAAVALVTTGTVTNLTSTAASIASANLGTAVVTTGTVTNLTATSASIASANAGAAVVTNLTVTGASIASANVGTGVVTALTVTGASIASANVGTGVITTLTATGASVASINAGVALVTTGEVTNLTSTTASIASANIGVAAIGTLSFTGASIASLNAGTATITTGNLTFSSTAQRITGDMSTATFSNRLAFQTSTANSATSISSLPNGTGTASNINCYNNSDPTNSSLLLAGTNATEALIQSAIRGTGTYLPMTFYTGGSERMRLDTSGNLGIGTASPVSKLSVGGNPPSSGVLAGVSAADSISLALSDNTNNSLYVKHVAGGAATFGTDSGGQLAFATNGFTERMRIDASGNVGIGTASPLTKLDVAGTSRSRLDVSTSTVVNTVTNAAANAYATLRIDSADYQFYTGNSEKVRIASDGSVGIGTASPVAKLDIISGTARVYVSNQSDTGFITAVNTTNTAYAPLAINGSSVVVKTGDAARMTVDSSGNVGIGGTANGAYKLNVLGTYPSGSNTTGVVIADGTIPSASTTASNTFVSVPSTQAASFTVSNLRHFYAVQGTIGAGSAVTNQVGFLAESNLTGATNNFGFYSNIASGSNRWNFYAAGTAQNYFAGNTGVGVTPNAAVRFKVAGTDATASNYAFIVTNSTPADLFWVRNDGEIYTGTAASSPYNNTTASAANVFVTSGGILQRSTSSLRYKTNVVDAAHGLADVLKLRSVIYKGKNDSDIVFGGLIAEEVHDAGLTEFVAYDKENRPDALHYGNMVALLVKAIQELEAKVAALEAK